MAVTIKDIAKIAGVSHTTVSRALKGNPAISPETVKRIQEISRELGYTPNTVAQSLLNQRTQTIGVVVTSIADPFAIRVVDGIEQEAQAAGYGVLLVTSHNDPQKELAVVEMLHRRRVDAIIVTSSRVGSLYNSRLNQIRVPIVLINNNQEQGEYIHSVATDDEQGARLAVEHLIQLGHRRIAYIGAGNRPRSNHRRLTGYRLALEQAGLPVLAELITVPDSKADLECGQIGLRLVQPASPTAIFCYNDVIAIGLLLDCQTRKITIPDQLSVVGFDNIEPSTYVSPPLTTVAQSKFSLGQRALKMTLELLDGNAVNDQTLPCYLVVRQSTGPPSL